jgi:tellurite methyltransferase
MEREFWDNCYATSAVPTEPSSFARDVVARLKANGHIGITILDLGCGNCRDSNYFAAEGYSVVASDQCNRPVEAADSIRYVQSDCTEVPTDVIQDAQAVYMRFFLHSLRPETQDRLMERLRANLKSGALVFVEVRSTEDPMYKTGTKISSNENRTDHYRRYFSKDDLNKAFQGFYIKSVALVSNACKYKDDNPPVWRLYGSFNSSAHKPGTSVKVRTGLLDTITKLFSDHHIPWTLAYGSLLGYVRSGQLIANDDDIDAWIPEEHSARVIELLKTHFKPTTILDLPKTKFFNFVLSNGAQFDIYFLSKTTQGYLDTHSFWGDGKTCKLDFQVFDIGDEPGRPPVPKQAESVVEYLYGPRWRTPLRKYIDYITHSTPEGRLTVLYTL